MVCQQAVRQYPPLVSYDVERVQQVTTYLDGLGVDVKRAVEQGPILLAGKLEQRIFFEDGEGVSKQVLSQFFFSSGKCQNSLDPTTIPKGVPNQGWDDRWVGVVNTCATRPPGIFETGWTVYPSGPNPPFPRGGVRQVFPRPKARTENFFSAFSADFAWILGGLVSG